MLERSSPIRQLRQLPSSANALRGLVTRGHRVLGQTRALGSGLFFVYAVVFGLGLGHRDLRRDILPIGLYGVVAGWLWWALRAGRSAPLPGRQGAFAERLAELAPLLDAAFIIAVEWTSVREAASPRFSAGLTLGLLAMPVVFAVLTLSVRTILGCVGLAIVGMWLIVLRVGVTYAGLVTSSIVLLLIGLSLVWAVRELSSLLDRLVSQEVELSVNAERGAQTEAARREMSAMHDQLKQQHEALQRAQHEAETLTRLLVHDMKGPLTGILSMVEVVAEDLKRLAGAGTILEDVRVIDEQGRRLLAMVRDLLTIARLESGAKVGPEELIAMPQLLEKLRTNFAPRAQQVGARIELHAEAGVEAPAHRETLHRLLDNLIANALDFVSLGDRILLEARVQADWVQLAVRNTGPPIPPSARARLFEKNVQGERRGRHNLGLGLYFCRLAAQAHGGSIALEDSPDWPVSFVVRLPREPDEGAVRDLSLTPAVGVARLKL